VNLAELTAHDDTPPAPGALDVLQRFMNLHEHVDGRSGDLPPSPDLVREFLVARGLLPADARYTAADHAAALALHEALHELLRFEDGDPRAADAARRIEEVARRVSFRLRLDREPTLEPTADGIDGALGRLLALLFLAELDGGWAHMKECASETCSSVFYDRSKNRSGKWCSMQTCGNKHKVRAWRERHRAEPAGSASKRDGDPSAKPDAVDA
jgi:predicted RNA-binding Zn ribbon-like protein